MNEIKELISLIDSAISEEPSNTITSGGIIKDWYDSEVDEIRNIINNSREWLAEYQNRLVEETWIAKLKIKFTNVFGYFIEVPLASKDNVPDSFVHKQTLVSAVRYITEELKDFEKNLVEGEGKLAWREYDLFLDVREKLISKFDEVKKLSTKTAKIDMMSWLAKVAYDSNYVKPELTNSWDLEVKSWRHPIIEKIEPDFISNDLKLTNKDFLHIITWPNMWGKSTFLRQNSLIILMSHIGSYVPAKSAKVPLTDKLFSRVWAQDNLFLGQSTFMVEMQEMANILHNYTEKSFVIIDEIGRGTSTFDGMSIAWAVLKHLHDETPVKTLFATHYHELIDESKILKWVSNYSVAVGENSEWIIFLRKIIKWWINKSYGLEVAKLGWISDDVIKEARKMLVKLEAKGEGSAQLGLNFEPRQVEPEIKYIEKESQIENDIKMLDVNNLTPLEALNKLYELKNKTTI